MGLEQDTPAIACKEDIEEIESILRNRLGAYYEEDLSLVRTSAMASFPDGRTDVCLYLIEPHQLPEVDVEAIKKIGKYCAVVPLLAKVKTLSCRLSRSMKWSCLMY